MRHGLAIDRPDLDAETGAMSQLDESTGDDARRARPFRHLISAVADARDGPPAPRAIQRPTDFFACSACRNRGFDPPRLTEHPQSVRPEAHAIERVRLAHHIDRGVRELGAAHLQLDDDWNVAISVEHIRERRYAARSPPKRKAIVTSEEIPRVRPRELVRRTLDEGPREVGRPCKRAVVVHDDDAVAREVDVELKTVGAQREATVEGHQRVLGRKRTAPAMRERQPTASTKERMSHSPKEV